MINNYRLLGKLGSGSYGSVHLCEDEQTGLRYAIKIVDKSRLRRRRLGQTDEQLLREVRSLATERASHTPLRKPASLFLHAHSSARP